MQKTVRNGELEGSPLLAVSRLVGDADSDLDVAGEVGLLGDAAEVYVAEGGVWPVELRGVEGVGGFGTELAFEAFHHGKGLV